MTDAEIRAVVLRQLGEIAPEADSASIRADADQRDQLDLDSMDVLNLVSSSRSTRSSACPSLRATRPALDARRHGRVPRPPACRRTVGSLRAKIRADPEGSGRGRRHDKAMRIAVHDGRVACPRRGDIDVETCFACRSFQSLEGRAVLRCHEPVLLGPRARWSRRLVLPARKTG